MVARYYKKMPSEMLGITDEYAAFCVDETAAYIIEESKKNEPKFATRKNEVKKVKSLKDFYEDIKNS